MGFSFLGKRRFSEAFPDTELSFAGKRLRVGMDVENVQMRDRRRRRTFVRRPIGIRKPSFYRRGYRSNRRPLSMVRFGGRTGRIGSTEWKYVDTTGAYAADTSGAVGLLNGSAEGVGPSQHVGRRTMIKSIALRTQCAVTAGTGIDQVHRVVVVYDRQPNGTALTWNDVFGGTNVNAFPDLDWRARFLILLDKKVQLNASADSGSQDSWNWYKRVNLPVVYDQTAGATIGSISTGSLYVMVAGNIAPGATAGTDHIYTRVRYTDR